MNIFYSTHKQILKKLLAHKVDFILVGGYAVNYHGYNRVTGDMDVWIKPDNENKLLLITALRELDFEEESLVIIESWDFTKPQLFHIGEKPDLTDFMTVISGVQYKTVRKDIIQADIDGLTLPIIQLAHLIQNKKASGRLKDLSDAEYLNKILLLKNK